MAAILETTPAPPSPPAPVTPPSPPAPVTPPSPAASPEKQVPAIPVAAIAALSVAAPPAKPLQPCFYFQEGRCRAGAGCKFAHVKMDAAAPAASPGQMSPSGVRPCRFFASGTCRAGAACKFSHGQTAATATAPALSAATTLLLQRLETGELPMYALDVECVATGKTHNDRSVAQIGLVDAYGRCVLNVYVKPAKPVVSYLTPLTGITENLIQERGVPLDEATAMLRRCLPPQAALVGTNIGQDAKWLGLRSPEHCALLVDLAALFRAWDNGRYVYFSQDHCAKVWLGATRPPGTSHDAVGDAAVSMALLGRYMRAPAAAKAQFQNRCLSTPRDPSFAVTHPCYEGVCQGNRKLCKCGAPHFT